MFGRTRDPLVAVRMPAWLLALLDKEVADRPRLRRGRCRAADTRGGTRSAVIRAALCQMFGVDDAGRRPVGQSR